MYNMFIIYKDIKEKVQGNLSDKNNIKYILKKIELILQKIHLYFLLSKNQLN